MHKQLEVILKKCWLLSKSFCFLQVLKINCALASLLPSFLPYRHCARALPFLHSCALVHAPLLSAHASGFVSACWGSPVVAWPLQPFPSTTLHAPMCQPIV